MDSEEASLEEKILQQLSQYGDSLLDTAAPKKLSKKKKANSQKSMLFVATGETVQENAVKRKRQNKKKKRRKLDDHDSAAIVQEEKKAPGGSKLRGEERHLQELRLTLGLTEHEVEKLQQPPEGSSSSSSPVRQVGGSHGVRSCPEVVVFDDPAKRKKKRKHPARVEPPVEDTGEGDNADTSSFDLKRARAEVRKFGIRGLDTRAKEQATMDMLIALGAKPVKKQPINYRELQEQRKQEMAAEITKREVDRSLGYKVKKVTKRPRKGQDDIKYLDGQIGRYKSGVQVISKRDIASKGKSSAGQGKNKGGKQKR